MKKINIASIVLLILSVVLAVISFIVLPDTVIVQLPASGSDATTSPKLLAVLVPFALGIGGSLFTLFNKDDRSKRKTVVISVVGVLVFGIMLFINLNLK